MKRIVKWVNNLKLRFKIIFYSYIVILPILIAICVFLMINNYDKLQEAREETNINHINSLSDSIDLVMTDVQDISMYIAINQEITDILKSSEPEKLNNDSRLWTHNAPINMVKDMMALKGYINTIAIYPENGVKPFLKCTDASSYIQTLDELRETKIYQSALEKKGKKGWAFVPRGSSEVYANSRFDKLVLYREVYDLSKNNPLGYIVIGIPYEKLEKQCVNYVSSENEGIIIFNEKGEELVSYGMIEAYIKDSLEAAGKTEGKKRIGSYDVFTSQQDSSAPIICKVVPRISFGDMFWDIALMPLSLLLGVLVGLFPVMIFVSNITTRPLAKVCVAMSKFKKGDFDQQLEVSTTDEVGEVAACFNQMVKDIKVLIDKNYVMALKEKESELSALQAQINPHFLYNTLDALYWQACNAGNDDIAENIYSLSQLFRLVLGQGKGIINVWGEIELVSRYLEIHKLRFDKKMEYEIDVDEEIKDEKIPKLILQPFVENAVVHGIANSKEKCMIKITGTKDNGKMKFVIRDTGVGMTPEQVSKIWERKQEGNGSGYKIGGFAIYNVKERLELKYGQDFELKIESKQGEGTRVVIIIPFDKKEG